LRRDAKGRIGFIALSEAVTFSVFDGIATIAGYSSRMWLSNGFQFALPANRSTEVDN
jgi:hypothetical protein